MYTIRVYLSRFLLYCSFDAYHLLIKWKSIIVSFQSHATLEQTKSNIINANSVLARVFSRALKVHLPFHSVNIPCGTRYSVNCLPLLCTFLRLHFFHLHVLLFVHVFSKNGFRAFVVKTSGNNRNPMNESKFFFMTNERKSNLSTELIAASRTVKPPERKPFENGGN